MADNYLEDKYEEYLKRKAVWEKSRKHNLPVQDKGETSEKVQ